MEATPQIKALADLCAEYRVAWAKAKAVAPENPPAFVEESLRLAFARYMGAYGMLAKAVNMDDAGEPLGDIVWASLKAESLVTQSGAWLAYTT